MLSLWFLAISVNTLATARSINYEKLDYLVSQGTNFANTELTAIDNLKAQLRQTKLPAKRYALARAIFKAYAPLINDSAISYGYMSMEIAYSLKGNEKAKTESKLALVNQYLKSGYFAESIQLFHEIDIAKMPKELLAHYYVIGFNLFYEKAGYCPEPRQRQLYKDISNDYAEKVYALNPPDDFDVLLMKTIDYLYNKNLVKEAMAISDKWLKMCKPKTNEYAMMAYYRSRVYHTLNDIDMEKEWLVKSAICDIECGVMDQASLWTLAKILNTEGDIDRAYRYITISWSCFEVFSTHKRGEQASSLLVLINNNYKHKLTVANHRMAFMVVVLLLLIACMGGLMALLLSNRRKLVKARNMLSQSNLQLKKTVDQLNDSNRHLNEANRSLNEANRSLNEANRVKEGFIKNFFSMCSQYIEKLDNYRIRINRKLKAGQYKELVAMTASEKIKDDEKKYLLDTFDNIFLTLYPNYIEKFNSMLMPEYRVMPTDDQRLNTVMRIFALIKLGITQSSRIAEFLGYSSNTIYNYRTRTKNMAIGDRNTFEERLCKSI